MRDGDIDGSSHHHDVAADHHGANVGHGQQAGHGHGVAGTAAGRHAGQATGSGSWGNPQEEEERAMVWLGWRIGKLLERSGNRLHDLASQVSRTDENTRQLRQEVDALRGEVDGLRNQLHAMNEQLHQRLTNLLNALRRAHPENVDGRRTAEHDELSRRYEGWRSGDLVRAAREISNWASVDPGAVVRWRAEAMRELCPVLLGPADDAAAYAERLDDTVDTLLGRGDWRGDEKLLGALTRARDGAREILDAARALGGDHTWEWSFTPGELTDGDRHEKVPGSTGDRIESVVAPAYAIRGGWACTQLVLAS